MMARTCCQQTQSTRPAARFCAKCGRHLASAPLQEFRTRQGDNIPRRRRGRAGVTLALVPVIVLFAMSLTGRSRIRETRFDSPSTRVIPVPTMPPLRYPSPPRLPPRPLTRPQAESLRATPSVQVRPPAPTPSQPSRTCVALSAQQEQVEKELREVETGYEEECTRIRQLYAEPYRLETQAERMRREQTRADELRRVTLSMRQQRANLQQRLLEIRKKITAESCPP